MTLTKELSLLETESIDVVKNHKYGENCLHFVFKGRFTKEASSQATEAWKNEFNSNQEKRYTLIWDCTHMKNFDFDANNEWRRTLSTYTNQIDHIYLVSEAVLIRGAARIMSNVANLNLDAFKSIDEIPVNTY